MKKNRKRALHNPLGNSKTFLFFNPCPTGGHWRIQGGHSGHGPTQKPERGANTSFAPPNSLKNHKCGVFGMTIHTYELRWRIHRTFRAMPLKWPVCPSNRKNSVTSFFFGERALSRPFVYILLQNRRLVSRQRNLLSSIYGLRVSIV